MLDLLKYRIRQLKTDPEIDVYVEEFRKFMGYEVPADFLKKGKIWGVFNHRKELIGGWALVAQHPLRSIEEIPDNYPLYLDMDVVGESTAIWLKDKSIGFIWSLCVTYQHFVFPKIKYWIYSYPISEVRLGKYYKAGDPICLYKGPIKRLVGHLEHPEPEYVELLSNLGVLKIAIHRDLKYLKKLFSFKRG